MSQSEDPKAELSALQGARILAALEAVRTAAMRTTSEQRGASATIRRQQAELEALQEASQKISARGRDVRNSLQLLRESVDRAKLTALNAGLEGARLGDPLGKALVVMGDEVRNLLARSVDALDEHTALLAEVERERERALVDLVRIADGTRQATSALGRSEEQSQLTTALLNEIRTDLAELFGTDPEAAQVLADAAGQVKNMANSLLDLSQRSPLGVRALRELLAPLLALVPRDEEPPR
jgi:methyl-accepting chemotaxis protein